MNPQALPSREQAMQVSSPFWKDNEYLNHQRIADFCVIIMKSTHYSSVSSINVTVFKKVKTSQRYRRSGHNKTRETDFTSNRNYYKHVTKD